MSGFSHFINFIITIFFWPWIIVWVILAMLSSGNKTSKKSLKLQEEELELLRKIHLQNTYKNHRD